jgi:hypothetical protein
MALTSPAKKGNVHGPKADLHSVADDKGNAERTSLAVAQDFHGRVGQFVR